MVSRQLWRKQRPWVPWCPRSSPMLAGTRDNRNGGRSGVRGCRRRIPLARGRQGRPDSQVQGDMVGSRVLEGCVVTAKAIGWEEVGWEVGRWPTSNRQASNFQDFGRDEEVGHQPIMRCGAPHQLACRFLGPSSGLFKPVPWARSKPSCGTLTMNSPPVDLGCSTTKTSWTLDARFPTLWPLTDTHWSPHSPSCPRAK